MLFLPVMLFLLFLLFLSRSSGKSLYELKCGRGITHRLDNSFFFSSESLVIYFHTRYLIITTTLNKNVYMRFM
ncbi:hypothetical protein BDF21DRAFT_409867 [Thamnidium elegans]|nr:hypothetical protein BDF21DRAFT_409867 [Thamnidium elegans]